MSRNCDRIQVDIRFMERVAGSSNVDIKATGCASTDHAMIWGEFGHVKLRSWASKKHMKKYSLKVNIS